MKSAGQTTFPMLKKGDKVLCVIGNLYNAVPRAGEIYEVKEDQGYDLVRLKNSGSFWSRARFVLATELTKALS